MHYGFVDVRAILMFRHLIKIYLLHRKYLRLITSLSDSLIVYLSRGLAIEQIYLNGGWDLVGYDDTITYKGLVTPKDITDLS